MLCPFRFSLLVHAQVFFSILRTATSIPLTTSSPFSIQLPPLAILTLPPTTTNASRLPNAPKPIPTAWPPDPFTIPIDPSAFSWLWFRYIGKAGSASQTTTLLAIIRDQINLYSSQARGAPIDFYVSRSEVRFSLVKLPEEVLTLDLAIKALRTFQGATRQWGATRLEFSIGQTGRVRAGLSVDFTLRGGEGVGVGNGSLAVER
ncbi:hypothetical protein MMC28_006692 [Mycoblastus sanguinarius]|nr:hypothetical protein [Mycoblastus sanguinarius]